MSSVSPHDDIAAPNWPSLAGQLLVAMPGIDDERFEHAVILICTHDDEHAMGLRLDMPAPGVDLAFVLEKLETPTQGADGRPVLIGGPVEQERGFVLHTDDWFSESTSLRIEGGLAVTGTREALIAMGEITGPARSQLVLGYAGWDEGQLEDELNDNVWLTMEADPSFIFDDDHASKWSRALAKLGIDAANLSPQGGRA
ncbi:YqgE/AlgH family protein [uncultured Brevundimonas sp.]|uniref:YqgE/AlgH family protein n=1 Tax=uncultured Brevundimonas sp. TaxID=213418 RepID=UPI00261BD345|nr:YqgE/AlgH family protein [uncultured Brevundimonas sp.]